MITLCELRALLVRISLALVRVRTRLSPSTSCPFWFLTFSVARFAVDDAARPEYMRLALGLVLAAYSGYLDAYRIGFVFEFVKAATGAATLQQLGTAPNLYNCVQGSANGPPGQRAVVLLAFDTFLAVINWLQGNVRYTRYVIAIVTRSHPSHNAQRRAHRTAE